MNTDIKQTFRRLWEAACMDAPLRPSVRVHNGYFVLTITGNEAQWETLTKAAGAPDNAERTVDGAVLTVRWPSHADAIFGPDGLIAQRLPNYEVRLPQLHMARLVQRSIEMNEPLVVEAGTGVGKSYAYAAIGMAMNKRILISTSNKALQMQLYKKDIPFLCSIFPGKSVALAVGKGNYACRLKCDAGLPTQDLAAWYERTDTGNVEEIDFPVDWKQLAAMTVDDDCGGRHCSLYADCFYFDAKAQRQAAHVVITNHALLCLRQLYPGAGILPNTDVTVVDEAHKLADYARNTIGAEFKLTSLERTIEMAQPFLDELDTFNEAQRLAAQFERQITTFLETTRDPNGALPPQIGLNDATFPAGAPLAQALLDLAEEVWTEADLPADGDERKRARRAQRIRALADKVTVMTQPTRLVRIRALADKVTVMTQPTRLVRWLETADPVNCKAAPSDVSSFIGELAGVATVVPELAEGPPYTHCARCHRTLTAEKVAILDGHPYGPECIKYVDVLGDAETLLLADWLALDHDAQPATPAAASKAVIFCSATLAAPDLSGFLREAGLPDALQMVAASPFDYQNNALLYLPNGACPQPADPAWREWVIEEIDRLVVAAGGGAFLLFTSISMMQYAADRLRTLWLNRFHTMVQNELPKLEIARRFRDDGNAVLFATKSFFEGVSIDGQALRLVVVDKMPFEAPNPLAQAMEADALAFARTHGYTGKTLEMYPFNNLRVPKMIIELKQAAGRLIRTATDTGVIAVLDSRVRSSQYGRNQVLPALPPAPVLSNSAVAADFLRKLRPAHKLASAPPAPPASQHTATATLLAGGNGKPVFHFDALPVRQAESDPLWS